MVRKGESMGYRESFDEFYSKKLNELKVQLKSVLYGDLFVVGPEYACEKKIAIDLKCQGRVKLHTQEGGWFCLRCALKSGAVAPRWSKDTRERVEAVMAGYPDANECYQEWQAGQPKFWTPEPRTPKKIQEPDPGKIEFGRKLKEARQQKGLTLEELAKRISKSRGGHISGSSIQMYESGSIYPPEHIMVQLVRVLDLKLEQAKA